MQEFGPMVLPPSDYAALMASMENPPKPNKTAVAAMQKFKNTSSALRAVAY
jgi:uncharacterized protein (DUF1778 family)